jgi:hypothetical protein
VFGVFELPLPSNAQHVLLKKHPKKVDRWVVGGGVWDLGNARGTNQLTNCAKARPFFFRALKASRHCLADKLAIKNYQPQKKLALRNAMLSVIQSRKAVKKMMKVTYICRSPKTKAVTYFILFLFLSIFYRVFGSFVTRRVQKHDKTFPQKIYLGSSQQKVGFFSSVFFCPSVVLLGFVLSRFWAYLDKGSSIFPQPLKKTLTHLHLRHLLFLRRPFEPVLRSRGAKEKEMKPTYIWQMATKWGR